MIRKMMLGVALALASAGAVAAGEVNINEASAERLATALDGVGAVRAAAIVEYRNANGAFPSVASLVNVDGIGEGTLQRNRDRLTVGGSH